MRAFSLDSNALRYFLGFVLAHYDRPAIVSPWLSDVEVRLPLTNQFPKRQYRLTELVPELETKPTLVIKGTESHNEYIRRKVGNEAEFIEVNDLHAKAIISEDVVYAGSANITHGGFALNRELCKLVENEYKSTAAYLEEELDISRKTR